MRLGRTSCSAALFFTGAVAAVVSQSVDTQLDAARQAFERAAGQPERFFDVQCVMSDHSSGRFGCEYHAGRALEGTPFPLEVVKALTTHADPRVRTLAMGDLFSRGDPQVLPTLFARIDDAAPTFDEPMPESRFFFERGRFQDAPMESRTVAHVATTFLDAYLKRAGFWYGPRSTTQCPGFEHYWSTRQNRRVLASWFLVQLDLATQRTTPIRPGREAALRALRTRVDALPGDERWWYTLVVGADDGGEHVFSAAEVVQAGRALGPTRLMAMLEGKEPTSDPDLVPTPWPQSCGHGDVAAPMRRFVLRHASALLRPEDADALVRNPNDEADVWAIAAASLRPDRAEAILKAAIARSYAGDLGWEQARLAAALVRIAGVRHIPYAIDWFYAQPDARSRTTSQEIFLSEVVDRDGQWGRRIIVALVRDPRFTRIPEPALRTLARHVNGWLPRAAVPEPEGYVGDAEKAATFATWRAAIVQSAPRWQ